MTVVEQQEIAVLPITDQAAETSGSIGACEAASGLQKRAGKPELRIEVSHGDQKWQIEPAEYETFPFEAGDQLTVIPADLAAALPMTWGDIHVKLEEGRAIRVPPRIELFDFKGYKIPVHLINLTGAGVESFEQIGKAHIDSYRRYVGLDSHMTVVELGCGIGRDAFQLTGILDENGRYVGIDVTRDSITWCQRNITPRHPNFTFYHFDAENELYNPYGTRSSMDFRVPLADGSVDRIILASVFTHLLPREVLHYMTEFRRVLKPSGLVYASFFLYSPEAIAAAQIKGNTPWKATFAHPLGDGAYANDPTYPRGSVAFTDPAMRRMIKASGLRLVRPFLKGWWSGLYEESEDGQDAAVMGCAIAHAT
jgi:SAM-dependent methyltransferase